MLTLAKVPLRNLAYYADITRPDLGGYVEADGVWLGRAATELGLEGNVESSELALVCAGVDPRRGQVLSGAHHRVRVAAYDCTFAAPKSVSLLHALGDGEVGGQVAESHRTSIDAALGYLEDAAGKVRRRAEGRRTEVVATGLCAAAFVHRVSRSLDPHLHTHVVVANLAADSDGRWSALDARALFEHLSTAGALYRASLRRSLSERLGVEWGSSRGDFNDVVGFPSSVLKAFSQRSAEIAREMEAEHRTGARELRRVDADAHRSAPRCRLRRPCRNLERAEPLRRARAQSAEGDHAWRCHRGCSRSSTRRSPHRDHASRCRPGDRLVR